MGEERTQRINVVGYEDIEITSDDYGSAFIAFPAREVWFSRNELKQFTKALKKTVKVGNAYYAENVVSA